MILHILSPFKNTLVKGVFVFLTFFFSLTIYAQDPPDCDFGDLDGYFYNWKFYVDNPEYDFVLENNASTEVINEITGYEIDWGDGSPIETILMGNLSHTHTYSEGKFTLLIKVNYKGNTYEYSYTVYNKIPTVATELIQGGNGCLDQEFIFELKNYEDNPPSTSYFWDFGDNLGRETWDIDIIEQNNAMITHMYNSSSCDGENDVEHFSAGATPVISIGGNILVGLGAEVQPIIIFRDIELDIELAINEIEIDEEDLSAPHNGCVDNTIFRFTNNSDYGLEGFVCRPTTDHGWIITKYENGMDLGDAELDTDYFFESGSADAERDISIIFLKTGTYKISFYLAGSCSRFEETTGEISIYENENTTTYTPNDYCLEDDEIVSFITAEDPKLEAIQETEYLWHSTSEDYEFVEGTNANSQNPKIRFKDAGKHIVTLEKNSLCGVEEYEYIVDVSDVPLVRINNIPGLVNGGHCGTLIFSPTADFIDNGEETFDIAGNIIDTYEWTFNNNGIITNSTSREPRGITFDQIGRSSISLRASNSKCGWSAIDKIEFEIYEIPTPVINRVNEACQEEEISYTAEPNGMVSYLWTLGDGTTNNNKEFTHNYTNSGTFNETLLVTTVDGCSNSIVESIEIIAKPIVNAGADMSICNSDTSFEITDASVENYSSIKWTTMEGDGTFSDENILNPTYNLGTNDHTKSTIELILTAEGNGTCEEVVDSKIIYITSIPLINFDKTEDKICQDSTYNINGVNVENYSSVEWTASEPGTFANENVIETSFTPSFNFSGQVSLTLTAYGNGSCSETQKSFELEVVRFPTVDAGSDAEICEGEEVNLAGASNSSLVKWESSGDGVFSDENALSSIYTPGSEDINLGSVLLELQALGDAPCEASSYKRVSISKRPVVNAGADASICENALSYTIREGSGADMANASNYSSLLWTSSGTGSFTNETALNATYTPSGEDLAAGSVELSITAEADGSCSEAVSDEIILTFTDIPEVNAGVDTTVCQESPVSLSAEAENYSSVLWTTSGNGVFTDETSLITSYHPDSDETGDYILTLTAQSSSSCDPVSDELQITLIEKVNAEAGDDGEVCSNGTYNLSEGETGARTYSAFELEWTSQGDGSFDNTKIINANYTPGENDITNGSVELTLTAKPLAPCSADHSDVMTLQITPIPTVFAGQDEVICQGESLNMTGASAENNSSLQWETSSTNGFFENGTSLDAIYHPGEEDTGKYTLSLIAYGNGSCSYTIDELEIDITPAPNASIEDEASICEGGSYTIQNAIVNNSPSYTWTTSGSGTLVNINSLMPTYQAAANETGDISISLTVEGNGECNSKNVSAILTIVPHPFIDAGDDDEVCSNQTYNMNVGNGVGQIQAESWSRIEYLSSGDGFFTDQDGLQATYVPGEMDKQNTEVDITIRAYAINPPCDGYVEDVMSLRITPAPEVNAGTDGQICEGDSYELINATEQNTSELIWTDSNGGNFSDSNILQPVYIPANGRTGNVILQLTGKGNGSCNENSSQMSLQIVPVPNVEAGDNVSICFDKNYELESTIASSFSTINWTTSGSGTFSDDTELHPTYMPSDEDYQSGKVELTITVQGLSPCLMEARDVLELSFVEAPYVFAGNDDEICEENGAYTIRVKDAENPTGAEVQGVNSFFWETNGMGSLQNSNTLNPTYIPAENEIGTIQFTLKAAGFSNCENIEDTMELTIIPTPTADFIIGTSCIGSSVALQDNSNGGSFPIEGWSWDFGDGNISEEQNTNHEFSEIKDYSVNLSVTNNKGCSSSINKTVSIHPLPEVIFTHDDYAAIDIPTNFINESTNAIDYSWDFGDGTISSEVNPSHTYLAPDVYKVILEAESAEGCFKSDSSAIEVIGIPEAGFTKTPDGCGPLTVEFTNTSKGDYLSYFWDFGNGTNSSDPSPEPVIFEAVVLADTTYTVVLQIENRAGISRFTGYITVQPLPIPAFEILPTSYGCSPAVRNIFNYSEGLPDNYTFDFGDGETYEYTPKDIERPFEHTFVTGDTKTIYPVTLTASNECGDSTIIKNMTVFPNTTVAVFKADKVRGCAPLTVAFENFSVGAGDYLESDWIFEDGKIEIRDTIGETVYHTFEQAGIYDVQLSVYDTCAIDQTTQTIIVLSAPEIDFEINAQSLCDQEEISFSVNEEIKNTFTNFIWDMGDGSSKTGTQIIHKYASAQDVTVRLSAIYLESGCEKNVSKEITINKKPNAEFETSKADGCEPLSVRFSNKSTDATYYQWDFKDGAKSTRENTEHIFKQGSYNVSLISESEAGCSDTVSTEVVAFPRPVAEFTISDQTACITPFTLEVTNTTTNKDLNSYTWDFDNGTVSNLTDPGKEIYNDYGEFSIRLKADNQFLCADTSSHEFAIYKTPLSAYEIISTNTCEGEVIEFQDLSSNSEQSYWEFSDGFTTEGKTASHIFTHYGQYNLFLKSIGKGNCSDSIFVENAINIYPIPIADYSWENINTPPEDIELSEDDILPNNGTIQFNNLSDEVAADWIEEGWYKYEWDFNDLNSSYEKSPVHKYKNNGTFHVTLFTESPYSCKDSITKAVEVDLISGLFVPNAFNPGNPDPLVGMFLPRGIGLHRYYVEVIDNWGNSMWQSDKIEKGRPAEGWDGTKDGEAMPQGIYIWKIRAVFENGVSWQGMKINGKNYREGSVTLIR